MALEDERREYNEFRVALLNSRFKGVHTERETVEWLVKLFERRNVFAVKALREAKLTCAPQSKMANSVWQTGAIYNLVDVLGSSEFIPPI